MSSTFLSLYREGARGSARSRLGDDPPFCQVAADLLRDTSDSKTDRDARFMVSFVDSARCHIRRVARDHSMINWRAVCDLVPAETRTRVADPGPPDSSEDYGFCYAVLYAAESRRSAREEFKRRPFSAAVAGDLLSPSSPRRPSNATFRLTFGTPASVVASDKFLAHISEGHLLTLREVLRLVPSTTRLGAVEDDVSVVQAPPAQVPTPALGVVFDPLVRRRMVRAATLRASSGVGTPSNNAWQLGEVDPLLGPLRDFADIMPRARWLSVAVKFLPLAGASSAQVALQLAWYPATRSAPTDDATFEDEDTHELHTLAPASAGGACPSFSASARELGGVSLQVKPAPMYGGTARFAWRAISWPLPDQSLQPREDLYAVYVEGVLSAHA